jgi:hypothetical protein
MKAIYADKAYDSEGGEELVLRKTASNATSYIRGKEISL